MSWAGGRDAPSVEPLGPQRRTGKPGDHAGHTEPLRPSNATEDVGPQRPILHLMCKLRLRSGKIPFRSIEKHGKMCYLPLFFLFSDKMKRRGHSPDLGPLWQVCLNSPLNKTHITADWTQSSSRHHWLAACRVPLPGSMTLGWRGRPSSYGTRWARYPMAGGGTCEEMGHSFSTPLSLGPTE